MSRQFEKTTKDIEPDKARPIYQQLMSEIQMMIQNSYSIGEYLPPEVKLAEHYQVNRHTVRHALDELVKLGIIIRKAGKGTMVVRSSINYPIDNQTRFTSKLEQQGYQTSSELLFKKIIEPSAEVMHQLALQSGEKVIHFSTIRKVAETSLSLIDHYVSADRFSKIMSRFRHSSLQLFMQTHYQIELSRGASLISVIKPSVEMLTNLQLHKNMPLICIKTLNYDTNTKQPIEYSISYNRSDCMQIQVGENPTLSS